MKRIKGTENIFVIEHFEDSPMADHGFMEIASDEETGSFFIHETMLRTYGTESVIKSCKGIAEESPDICDYNAGEFYK